MRFYTIQPEHAGGVGANTVFDKSQPGMIAAQHVSFCFQFFPNDEIVGCPWAICMVADGLAAALQATDLTGYAIEDVDLTVDDQAILWWTRSPDELLHYSWLRLTGVAFCDDFGTPDGIRVVVSERALALLRGFTVTRMAICEARPSADTQPSP